MRKRFSTFSAVVVMLLLCATSALVVAQPFFAQDEENAKNLYLVRVSNPQKGQPGARIRIELLRDGQRSFVSRATTFKAGDKVKFHFETNFAAYVKILNVGTSGKLQLLFPYQGVSELVPKTKNFAIPSDSEDDTGWFAFDHKPGKEQLAFIFSQQPLRSSRPAARQGGSAKSGMSQAELAALNAEATDVEGAKDLYLVREEKNETYVCAKQQLIKKPLVLRINLIHGGH